MFAVLQVVVTDVKLVEVALVEQVLVMPLPGQIQA
jgi:hypothetical protein